MQLADRKCAHAHNYLTTTMSMLLRKPLHQCGRGTCAHLRLVRAHTHGAGPGKEPVSCEGAQAQMHLEPGSELAHG
eukprot:6174672-Pleurochrysis_carterae.AAC.1